MVVQSERNISIKRLLDQLKRSIDECEYYNTKVNKQLLIDCYDVIKASASEEDDAK